MRLRDPLFDPPAYMRGGLGGLLGALSFSTDKSLYKVGQKPIYRIFGTYPNAQIAWSSLQNGVPTGEYQAYYGHQTDDNGNAVITTPAGWTDQYIGQWQKEVIIIPPDYPNQPLERAVVSFSVQAAGDTTVVDNPPVSPPVVVPVPTPTPVPTPVPTPTPTPVPTQAPSSGGGFSDLLSQGFTVGGVKIPYVVAGGALLLLAMSSGGRR